jgi:hypothetical protein
MLRKITIIALALLSTTAFAGPGDYRAETGDLDFERGPRVHDEVNPDGYGDSFEDDEGFGYDEGAFLLDCDEAAAEYELAQPGLS